MVHVVRSRFYYFMALALGAVIVAGFARTYYLRPLFDLPSLPLLLHLHGLVFSAWLLLFVVQTQLIARRNFRLHQSLGYSGAALAVLVVLIGVAAALVGATGTRPRPMGLTGPQFLLFPLAAIGIFALCVGAAIALRRRAALHKRLMVLGMIAVLGPPVARLVRLGGQGEHFLAVQTTVAAFFVAWVLWYDWHKHHMVQPLFAIGGLLLVLSWPLRALIARSDAWVSTAEWLVARIA